MKFSILFLLAPLFFCSCTGSVDPELLNRSQEVGRRAAQTEQMILTLSEKLAATLNEIKVAREDGIGPEDLGLLQTNVERYKESLATLRADAGYYAKEIMEINQKIKESGSTGGGLPDWLNYIIMTLVSSGTYWLNRGARHKVEGYALNRTIPMKGQG